MNPNGEMKTPEYKVGDIVRYGDGSTALMKIEHISENHGGKDQHRYYGRQFFGSPMGAYKSDCSDATEKEILAYRDEASVSLGETK